MHDIYSKKSHELIETITKKENNDENTENLKTRALKLGDICILLKTTSWKNNIMKEAKELFYDKNFMNKLDANPYLMCFNNYVIDFEAKTHRKGKPDDYISKSTNIDYIPYDNLSSNNYCPIIQEINKFIDELFPDKELRRYMWEHLASILIGKNHSQTFNIYTGSGCNGKSKLVELMSRCLGDYKATVPITLITQSRNSIGSTSSEVVALMGVRYAVMQEPSKGDVINEGIMKEITGGDPIQARALFKDSVTFMPQFKLVVCTNVLFDINTNDDGTWRRIRICDFMSKFTDAPYENEDKFPKANFPYQYLIDQKIDEKFTLWAPLLMSKLVTMAYQTEGKVKDAKIVTSVSDNYREAQDYLTEFAKEKIGRMRDGVVKKTELMEEFKKWYTMNYGRATLPNGKEITDYMDKQYGKNKRGKWYNVIINYNNESDNEEQEQEQEQE
jgi:P4 family phage/plasmid primase-like protien